MKILIIKPSSFGDIVQSLPCASALKDCVPNCEIHWVVFNGWDDIVSMCPDVDRIITWNRKNGIRGFFDVLKKVKRSEYDLAIDLQGLIRSAFLARYAKAKTKIGVPGMKEFSKFLIPEVYPKSSKINATIRNLEPVRFLGLTNFKLRAKINIDDTILKSCQKILDKNKVISRFITIFPFSRGKDKNWSPTNYQTLLNFITNRYSKYQILILGQKEDFEKIVTEKTVDLCGQTDIKQLAGILSMSSLSIGADTGPMHLSSMLNVPSIFIFGNSDINETAPYIGNFSTIVNRKNKKKIDDITPSMVFSKVEKWLAE
ncbi:MAG: glycosyltransferase family 9 protein [Elusimicrobiota bacterium]|jgi:ADP-heptose:LPS heptosyltransferase|nr:glycosyltransferase family 9 protein [Elusimicrobiota bacterium]